MRRCCGCDHCSGCCSGCGCHSCNCCGGCGCGCGNCCNNCCSNESMWNENGSKHGNGGSCTDTNGKPGIDNNAESGAGTSAKPGPVSNGKSDTVSNVKSGTATNANSSSAINAKSVIFTNAKPATATNEKANSKTNCTKSSLKCKGCPCRLRRECGCGNSGCGGCGGSGGSGGCGDGCNNCNDGCNNGCNNNCNNGCNNNCNKCDKCGKCGKNGGGTSTTAPDTGTKTDVKTENTGLTLRDIIQILPLLSAQPRNPQTPAPPEKSAADVAGGAITQLAKTLGKRQTNIRPDDVRPNIDLQGMRNQLRKIMIEEAHRMSAVSMPPHPVFGPNLAILTTTLPPPTTTLAITTPVPPADIVDDYDIKFEPIRNPNKGKVAPGDQCKRDSECVVGALCQLSAVPGLLKYCVCRFPLLGFDGTCVLPGSMKG